MYKIRQASVHDVQLIQDLTYKVWPQTYAAILSKEQIDFMLDLMYNEAELKRQLNDPVHKFLLVYDDASPVGFASYSPQDARQWKLHKLYVLPATQKKGLGSLFIRHIINDLKLSGAASLILNVNRYNNARHFYEKTGFKIINEVDVPIGHGYFMNDYIMEIKMEDC